MFPERPRRDRDRSLAARARRAELRLESLEGRQLLSYSPIGSLPDLTVSAQAGAIAAYGGPISVTLDVRNLGASSTIEPLNLEPGATSTADATASHVGVYLLRGPNARLGSGIRIGEVAVPAVPQNSLVRVTGTVTLPNRPRGFPGSGGTVYLAFRADDLRESRDLDRANNQGNRVPMIVDAALPDLTTIAVDLPPVMQPGDVIAPSIKVANYGTVNITQQGPVTVLLVASSDTNYGPTDVILGRYQITDLPGLSQAPQRRTVLGDVTLDNPPNVVTLETTTSESQTVQLPGGSAGYFIGVIVDPLNEIRELHEIGSGPSSALQFVRRIGDVPGLPPAGTQSAPSPAVNLFPTPAFAPLQTISDFLTDPVQAAQAVNAPGAGAFVTAEALRGHGRKATTPAGGAAGVSTGGGAAKA